MDEKWSTNTRGSVFIAGENSLTKMSKLETSDQINNVIMTKPGCPDAKIVAIGNKTLSIIDPIHLKTCFNQKYDGH